MHQPCESISKQARQTTLTYNISRKANARAFSLSSIPENNNLGISRSKAPVGALYSCFSKTSMK